MDELTHTVRLNILQPERQYWLTADALAWSDARGEGQVPYDAVTSIHLYSLPGIIARRQRRLGIKAEGQGAITLSDSYFARIGKVEDRSATFLPFARALVARAAAANPELGVFSGLPRRMWVFHLLFLLVAVSHLIRVAGAVAAGQLWAGDVLVLIAALFLLLHCWRVMRRGWARRIDPYTLPAQLPFP